MSLLPRRSKPESLASAPTKMQSLLDTRPLAAEELLALFAHADSLREKAETFGNFYDPRTAHERAPKVIGLLFFEASTRTRMSFQTAAYRLGHQVLTMEFASGSSLVKGETYADTVLNVAAMEPDVLVVRYGKAPELDRLLPELPFPVINAGSGTLAHPTQGLLDAYTIHREWGSVTGKKVLIVGDIRHSRVARSNFDVLSKLGAKLGVCGPRELLPRDGEYGEMEIFSEIESAIAWCDVYMGLRIQLERHEAEDSDRRQESLDEYHRQFGLNRTRLTNLAKKAIIMHPGPINHGVEFGAEVMSDSRSRILEQVKNGVLIRAALLARATGERREESTVSA